MLQKILSAVVFGIPIAATVAEQPAMGLRHAHRETVLVEAGQARCKIIFPGGQKLYAELAGKIAAALDNATGCAPELIVDTEGVEDDRITLKPNLKAIPIILLGNINNNRAVITQYAAFRCAADARYPGDDGYVLRTISNPYGTGQNQIMIGASTDAGAQRGVDAFLSVLRGVQMKDGRFICPHLLRVEPGRELRDVLGDTGASPASAVSVGRGGVVRFASSALRYQWSGHIGWARRARQYVLAMLKRYPDHFPDMHYDFSKLLRGWDMVEDSGVFSAEEITEMDNRFLRTTIAFQKAGWRGRRAVRTIGNRHGTAGTSSFHLMVAHLLRSGTANDTAKGLLLRWQKETQAYLHSVAKHFHNPHDSATALDAISDTYWYCLENGDLDFFTSGNARNTASYALMCWDNMGYAAGIDGYEAALPGYVRTGRGIGLPLAVNAVVYQDGRYKKLLRMLPNTTFVEYFMPRIAGIHEYATGPELLEQEPEGLVGVTTLPVVEPRYQGVSQKPYDRITRGVIGTSLPYERCVNKVCFRTGFAADDQYLLLQGFQGSTMGTIDGNCIVRFCEAGHVFLFHSTEARTHYNKNGVHVSRGHNPNPTPAACSLDVCVDLPNWGFIRTTLPDCHGSDWGRNILWRKRGFFVVLDRVRFKEDGEYSVSCNWRTPQHATWDGVKWQTTHNGDTFVLRPASPGSIRARREELVRYGSQMGATAPWVLRQERHLMKKAGEEVDFANVFYVVRDGQRDTREIRGLGSHEVLLRDGADVSLLGVSSADASALDSTRTDAALYVLSPTEILVAGAKVLAVAGHEIARARQPFDLQLDLPAATATVRSKGKVALFGREVEPGTTVAATPIVKEIAARLAREVSALWASAPAPSFKGVPKRLAAPLRTVWEFDGLEKAAVPIPVVRVESSVPAERDWPVESVVDTLLPIGEVAVWSFDRLPTFDFDLGKEEEVAEIRILTRSRASGLKAEVAFDGGAFVEAPIRAFDFNQNHHKGSVRPFHKYVLDAQNKSARKVRLKLSAPGVQGSMAVDEIEIARHNDEAALVMYTCAAKLGPPGPHAILFATDQQELVALDLNGEVLWRQDLDQPISAVAAFDCDGDGVDEIFVATHGLDVRRLDAKGREVWCPKEGRRTMTFGTMAYAMSMYQPVGEFPRIVVGHYHYTSILDAGTGKRLHIQRTGGAYCRAATCPTKLNHNGPTVAFLYNSWASGVAAVSPGLKLDRFSGIREQTRLFEVVDITGSPTPELLEVTDEAVRLHELPSGKTIFTLTPLSPIGAATVLTIPDKKLIVVALTDGFVLFVDAQGTIVRKTYLGEAALSVATLGDRLLFATNDGLLVCNAAGKLLGAKLGAWLGVRSLPGAAEPCAVAWTTRGKVVALGLPGLPGR